MQPVRLSTTNRFLRSSSRANSAMIGGIVAF